jgi:hypothetical protein
MNKKINFKLETIREFQDKYPLSHIGGSIGLMIMGYDLKRDLDKSDLDITTPSYDVLNSLVSDIVERSDGSDFDFAVKKEHGSGLYTKIDIRVSKDVEEFEVINYLGHNYNVTKLNVILDFKKQYSDKGYFKHTADLEVIKTGVRPLPPLKLDDLPY